MSRILFVEIACDRCGVIVLLPVGDLAADEGYLDHMSEEAIGAPDGWTRREVVGHPFDALHDCCPECVKP